ncbi:hypothetical protein BCR43DRAFT_524481 [Syncephalastrum racemosum]|uniref:Rap-GAP domain-containing protein n=1 Tax=Syncephalastrum racemosum TaxID=13706 RepID=A0A1X2HDG8_SYNRA|nr:hypothetical protein BCR43DRAFT_524481 [Syncephalastrum racemosum]
MASTPPPPPPTIIECCDWCCAWVTQHCTPLQPDADKDLVKRNFTIAIDSTAILVRALDAPSLVIDELTKRVNALSKDYKNDDFNSIQVKARVLASVCQECRQWIDKTPSLVTPNTNDRFFIELPRIGRLPAERYSTMWPDQMDMKAYWFRQYFVGKPYVTLIGQEDTETILISVVCERVPQKESGSTRGTEGSARYRILARGNGANLQNERHLVSEATVKRTESQLEELGQGYYLDCSCPIETKQRRRPLRSISSAIISHNSSNSNAAGPVAAVGPNTATRTMRASVRAVYPDIDLRQFRELSAEATILAGLEKEILRFDEMEIPKFYKFGILTVKDGQDTEEAWFGNCGLSKPLERFLHILGEPVALQGYKGYTAGLDTKTGESGELSYATSWRDYEIMFHVAPLMPWRDNDKQHVHRKRYIGNDIVCLVFIDGDNAFFNPDIIRSQFLHIFVIVRPEQIDGKEAWRVQVVSKNNVVECTPQIPSPGLIFDEAELRGFLLLKMINAENVALKCSEKFTIPNRKARAGVLKSLCDMGLKFTPPECTNTGRQNRLSTSTSSDGPSCASSNNGMSSSHSTGRHERPKSAGAQRGSRGSMRSIRAALTTGDTPPPQPQQQQLQRSITPDIPPVPSSSRSSMLRDWKNLARRRSSGGASSVSSSIPPKSPSPASRGASPLLFHEPEGTAATAAAPSEEEDNDKDALVSHPTRSMSNGGIRSRAQHLVTSVMGRRNSSGRVPPPQPPATPPPFPLPQLQGSASAAAVRAAGGLIRSKTIMIDHAGKLIEHHDGRGK